VEKGLDPARETAELHRHEAARRRETRIVVTLLWLWAALVVVGYTLLPWALFTFVGFAGLAHSG
jgi:hypothetical protein